MSRGGEALRRRGEVSVRGGGSYRRERAHEHVAVDLLEHAERGGDRKVRDEERWWRRRAREETRSGGGGE